MLCYLAIHSGSCSTCFMNSSCQVTPLHVAAHGGHVDTVGYLVDKGANTNIQAKNGVSKTTDCKLVLLIFPSQSNMKVWY